ncbi:DNA-binding GntR family transcriptional regulator [Streptomyces rishiriensis]|uniref:DNA-binding GntR family transcriptional regulator n=1 Tax=Streptomyces rishiriensis TaxID=68264 RepID=A0ABU0NZE3_STRRH|nr:DNA-binding GntR family transcriptional regulator [Streptomyces rishiriensis]
MAGDLIAYVEAYTRFHLGLPAPAGNAHLAEVVRELRGRARPYGLTALTLRLGPPAGLRRGAGGAAGRPAVP